MEPQVACLKANMMLTGHPLGLNPVKCGLYPFPGHSHSRGFITLICWHLIAEQGPQYLLNYLGVGGRWHGSMSVAKEVQ